MKTWVVNQGEESGAPFLRGILIRSLLDAGLEFPVAQDVADRVRSRISDRESIDSAELRVVVLGELRTDASSAVIEQYESPQSAPARIVIEDDSGESAAFSRAHHERTLEASGLAIDDAERVTVLIYDQLLANGIASIRDRELATLTYCCLRQECGKSAARRYLTWLQYQNSNRPLVLALCGTVGAGKSTIATEVAHRFGIVRTQSTDMLREVMRTLVPNRLLPVLHVSSYEAWTAMPGSGNDRTTLLAKAFRMQAEMLMLPCEAVINRAIQERVPMILEGVHALPELRDRLLPDSDAIFVHVTLAVLKSKQLKSQLKGRSRSAPGRKARHHLANLESIWELQSLLLSEADQHDAAIIPNTNREKTILQVIRTVNHELGRRFDAGPEEVFGAAFRLCAESEDWRQAVLALGGSRG